MVAIYDHRDVAGLIGGPARHAEIDAVRCGNSHMVRDDAAREFRDVDGREATFRHTRFLAREGQQLFDEMRRTREPRA